MKEQGDRRSSNLSTERWSRRWLARLFGCRAVRQSMIKNENTGDPVREKPAAGHELNSQNQDHGPMDQQISAKLNHGQRNSLMRTGAMKSLLIRTVLR